MKPHWYRWQDDTLFLQLHVQPRRRRNEFKGLLDNRLCPIPKPPENGGFRVSKSRTELIKGSKHRDKCVAIHSPTILPDWFLELAGKRLKNQGNF